MHEQILGRLRGSWYLDEAYAVDDAGTRLFDVYGARPDGIIYYGEDGRMMALITHEGRARLHGDRQGASAEERAEAYKSSIAYAGTYSLEGDCLLHHVDISTYPNWVGADLPRFLSFEGEAAVLRTSPQIQDSVLTVIKLVWRRSRRVRRD